MVAGCTALFPHSAVIPASERTGGTREWWVHLHESGCCRGDAENVGKSCSDLEMDGGGPSVLLEREMLGIHEEQKFGKESRALFRMTADMLLRLSWERRDIQDIVKSFTQYLVAMKRTVASSAIWGRRDHGLH